MPTLAELGVSTTLSETRIEYATGIASNDIVILGGTHTNELGSEFLRDLLPRVKAYGEDRTARYFEVMGLFRI